MKTLTLDLGTTTGFAVGDAGTVQASGTASFKNGRYEGGGMRYLRFRKWITEFITEHGVKVVYFEEVRRHQGVDAAHVYGGLLGQLTAVCEELEVPYQGIPVGEIKKAFTGKGNAGKELMIEEAIKRGFNPADDNEADAIAIFFCAEKRRF